MKRKLLAIAVPLALGFASSANALVYSTYDGEVHQTTESVFAVGADAMAPMTFDFSLDTASYLSFEGFTSMSSVLVSLSSTSVLGGWLITPSSSGFSSMTSLLAAGDYSLSTMAFGDPGYYAFETTVTPVPEPETYGMFLAGLGMLGLIARRKLDAKA
ncbi:FxDxF family PEP-CTERM protein [Nitrogeniibacter aestuarii]|uniref:FxDxF family PEP-CTERM protein n=1 Tax=Nitrogeniibacter aestuarii TaxID=2815343 RepID=UPI001E376533|nr:FxDxF family PEP-CTERM protein [Nitrogeniibacter aestuarii]